MQEHSAALGLPLRIPVCGSSLLRRPRLGHRGLFVALDGREDGLQPTDRPGVPQPGELPGTGRAQGDAPGSRAPHHPRTSSIQEWNTTSAYGPWTSSKKVASTGPVESSRVRNTTRRPERTGGVWVATLTPPAQTVERLRAASRSALRVTPRARSSGA